MTAKKKKPAAAIAWPADQVHRAPLEWFKPFKANAKQHSREQVQQIRAAIEQWGWTMPLLADEAGELIAGHGRLLAAKLKPAYPEAPVIIAKGWSEEQKRAYRIADNKLTENGQWDMPLLKAELMALDTSGFDLSLTGFAGLELAGFGLQGYTTQPGTDPDEVPPVPLKPMVKPGELWLLGEHRLLIGDSTKKEDVERLLKDGRKTGSPNLMVTDPPYGVSYNARWRLEAGVNKPWQTRAEGKVSNDDNADWTPAWALFPGDVAYVWHGGVHAALVAGSLNAANFLIRSQIIWAKNSLVMGRGDYHWQHEPCWYAVRKGKNGGWAGDRKQSTVWEIANMHRTQGKVDDGKTNHSTQKPVECMRRPIINNSKPGDGVYDPFCGSGTTVIAAETEGRRCYAMEIDPAYGQMIIERWQAFANKIAKREDGRTLSELKKGGGKNAKGSAGKSVPGDKPGRAGKKRRLRKKVPARLPQARRGADSEPPAVDATGAS